MVVTGTAWLRSEPSVGGRAALPASASAASWQARSTSSPIQRRHGMPEALAGAGGGPVLRSAVHRERAQRQQERVELQVEAQPQQVRGAALQLALGRAGVRDGSAWIAHEHDVLRGRRRRGPRISTPRGWWSFAGSART